MFDDVWKWTDLDDRWLGEIDRRNKALSAVIHAARLTQGDNTAAYLCMMGIRLLELHRVLKDTGSIYLHCDPTASHYLKASMDAIFGKKNFMNELVWKRTSAHSRARRYGPIHDIVLFYSRGGRYVWNKIYQPYDKAYVEKIFRHKDDKGRHYSRDNLTGPGTNEGSSGLPWRGYDPIPTGRHWEVPPDSALPEWFDRPAGYSDMSVQERLDVLNEQGLIYIPKKKGGVPRFKRYLSVMQGLPAQDVFTDIDPISARASERTGWKTQKPVELLQRIIKASSNPGDVVLDPFAGCATACEAAEIEGRQWVGIEYCEAGAYIIQLRLDQADLGHLGTLEDIRRIVTIRRDIPIRTDPDGIALAKKQKTKAYKTDENFNELYGKQRGDCPGCTRHFQSEDMTFDHRHPQAKGGGHELDNLQLLCGPCNSIKGDDTMEDLKRRLKKREEHKLAKLERIGQSIT